MIRLLVLIGAALTPTVAMANDDIALSSSIYVERLASGRSENSRVILEPLKKARSGDRLIYILEYRNVGTRPVSDFVVSNPLPRAVRFDETIYGDELVSVDNGRNWGRMEDIRIPVTDGRTRAATAADVTHLKWQMPQKLASGQSGRVTFRAIVR